MCTPLLSVQISPGLKDVCRTGVSAVETAAATQNRQSARRDFMVFVMAGMVWK